MLTFSLFACKSTKLVKDGQHLLMKNKVVYEDRHESISGVSTQIKHKPNRKILGLFRFHLSLHNFASSKRDSTKNDKKWRSYFRNKIGEAPVLFDSTLMDKSAQNIKSLLMSKGYFDAEVKTEYKLKKKKAKWVKYKITTHKQYSYDTMYFAIQDDSIDYYINQRFGSVIKGASKVDFEFLGDLREDMTAYLKGIGYYYFKKDYISFELDTATGQKSARVKISIANSTESEHHIRCRINTIHFIINGDEVPFTQYDTLKEGNRWYTLNDYKLNTAILDKFCSFEDGAYYNPKDEVETYSGFAGLNLFDFIDVKYRTSGNDSSKLDVSVYLKAGYRHKFSIEPQAITSDDASYIDVENNNRNFGVANTITWTSKNVFRNAEQLDLSSTTSLQAQAGGSGKFFNSFNQSVNATLFLPKSRLLDNWAARHDFGRVRTSVSASFIYEDNIDFSRRIVPVKLSYRSNRRKHFLYFTPIEVNYSNSIIKSDFYDSIKNPLDREFYDQLFAANLITNSSLGYIFSNKKSNNKSYWYIRSKVLETGGLLHRLTREAVSKNEDSYNLFGVHYYQYLKSDIDIRYNQIIDKNNALVYRLNTGLGLPYWNSNILPFEKRFFVGGANSLRGWRPRTIGPGDYTGIGNQTSQLERTGEFMVLFNTEYRFQLIKKYVESALFFDMGNVWNVTEDEKTAKGFFDPADVIKDMAMNTGIGLRFDFQFFMVRFDWGFRLKDPSLPESEKWVINNKIDGQWLNDYSVLNLGIGYPF